MSTTEAHAPGGALPRPTTARWQPLRLGLVDLFYYDDEQFWFHDGRLLLRGNNGTGKSKVLALTLPFLLDGSVHPRRVEPDADPKKRMDWNLLLGGAHPHTERTGYSWIEFGRLDPDGTEHYCTLGIGLKAATGRGIVKTWYFTTSRRIGDLRLTDDTRTVLSQERLRDTIEPDGSGHVHKSAEAYRRAVDEALFGLGEERYAALVDLLIQLRQPQLSKRPDPKALSAALTAALRPVDQAVVSDVAESFRSLEEERLGIEGTRATLGAAHAFLRHYRAYAAVAARRGTTAVRQANSEYERVGREQREVETALADVRDTIGRLGSDERGVEESQGMLVGEDRALRESPEMQDAERLDQADRAATDAERRAAAASAEAERARSRSEQEAQAAADARRRLDDADRTVERHGATAARLAGAAGLGSEHPSVVDDEAAARRAVERRRGQVRHVQSLVRAADAAGAEVARSRSVLDVAEADRARRAEEAAESATGVDDAVGRYRDDVHAYLAGLTSFAPDRGPAEHAAAAEDWARTLQGESPVRAAVESAAARVRVEVERHRASAVLEAERLDAEIGGIRKQIAELESGRDPEPPPVPGRDPQVRAHAEGAPLWRVADFAADVSAADRAGLEAALQSAGMLDAWVFPDGRVDAAGDVVLGTAGAEGGATLAGVLTADPGPDEAVPADVVTAVLRRIGLGEESGAALWVDVSGRWGSGPARGRWAKDRAEYVGAGARAAHRRTRLAELATGVRELEDLLAAARATTADAARRLALVDEERSSYPVASERDLAAAHERAAGALREVARARERVDEARNAWEWARGEADTATRSRDEAAAELGLGTSSDELESVLSAAGAYAEALVEVRAAARAALTAARDHERASERAADAADVATARDSAARAAGTEAATARATADALQSRLGATVAELQARLAAIGQELAALGDDLKRIAKEQRRRAADEGTLEERGRDLEARRDETAQARDAAVERLHAFAGTGLLRVALPELAAPDPDDAEAWGVTATLGLARTAEQELDGVDEGDDAWNRAQQHVSTASTELTAQMSRHGHTAYVEQRGDVLVARVRYLSEEVDVDRLATRLEADVAERERLLTAREREILENHLVNEVAGHLHELLAAAQGQIDRMNLELAERKTSTGMQLRVMWRERADGPAGLADARDLMTRSDATWTARDRAGIGDFLQARIAEVREADPTASWQEHLERALDYRQWHTFVVERRQNGQWRLATGPASGGERVLAMSVPLFAAASSHYNSAGPHAPRLILLDEAFAGVDDDSRAKSLGLLATFDLDVVMTSEREWGCYPQVPGLAIAQLSRVEGLDAVGVTRWRWDGTRREREPEPGAGAAAGPTTVLDEEEALFA